MEESPTSDSLEEPSSFPNVRRVNEGASRQSSRCIREFYNFQSEYWHYPAKTAPTSPVEDPYHGVRTGEKRFYRKSTDRDTKIQPDAH